MTLKVTENLEIKIFRAAWPWYQGFQVYQADREEEDDEDRERERRMIEERCEDYVEEGQGGELQKRVEVLWKNGREEG